MKSFFYSALSLLSARNGTENDVGGVVDGDNVRIECVAARRLLVFGAHEVTEAALVVTGTVVQQELGHHRIFVDDRHVQHVLSCGTVHHLSWSFTVGSFDFWITIILLVHVDVVDELGEDFDDSFGQVRVQRRRAEETQMQDRFTNAAPFRHVPARVTKFGYVFQVFIECKLSNQSHSRVNNRNIQVSIQTLLKKNSAHWSQNSYGHLKSSESEWHWISWYRIIIKTFDSIQLCWDCLFV